MKTNIISGAAAVVLGLLIAFGAQFLFKSCKAHDGALPMCHWSVQGEIGIGLAIAALGICLLILTNPKTQLGLTIGIFMFSIVALVIPNWLIGGCMSMEMACRRAAFPALTAISIAALIGAGIYIYYLEKGSKS
jgi:hypothetical protein